MIDAFTKTEQAGGPAFPSTFDSVPPYVQYAGMTLRDYFAGQVVPAIIAVSAGQHSPVNPYEELTLRQTTARDAYELADAMIAERDQQRGPHRPSDNLTAEEIALIERED